MKIVIVISGGTLQSVFAESPSVDIQLLDFDDMEAEGITRGDMDAIEMAATAGLMEVQI